MEKESLFKETLDFFDDLIYQKLDYKLSSIKEEKQNKNYGGGQFNLNSKSIRFRLSKITAKKVGQFVAFWEKDDNNRNQAFDYKDAPELWVISSFKNTEEFGQFVFPREVLLRQGVLKSYAYKGKMGMRLYPSWDHPESKQALKTQAWQLKYFVNLSKLDSETLKEIKDLYSLIII